MASIDVEDKSGDLDLHGVELLVKAGEGLEAVGSITPSEDGTGCTIELFGVKVPYVSHESMPQVAALIESYCDLNRLDCEDRQLD